MFVIVLGMVLGGYCCCVGLRGEGVFVVLLDVLRGVWCGECRVGCGGVVEF